MADHSRMTVEVVRKGGAPVPVNLAASDGDATLRRVLAGCREEVSVVTSGGKESRVVRGLRRLLEGRFSVGETVRWDGTSSTFHRIGRPRCPLWKTSVTVLSIAFFVGVVSNDLFS